MARARDGTVFDEHLAEWNTMPSTEPCKDAENERPVPDVWRPTITTLVRRLAENDLTLTTEVHGVAPLSADTARRSHRRHHPHLAQRRPRARGALGTRR